jgi:hypothetical protein
MFKEAYKCANKKIPVKTILLENTKSKIDYQNKGIFERYTILNRGKYTAIPICFIIFFSLIAGIPHIINNHTVADTHLSTNVPTLENDENSIGSTDYGRFIPGYYRYNGNWYRVQHQSTITQENISKPLDGIFGRLYEIKGVDSSKSIALFYDDGYYRRFDYVFKDTIIFQGKTYFISPNESTTFGKYLGEADNNKVYELPGSDPSKEIIVKINNSYLLAWQK